jgi:hypothetical protein
MEYALGSIITLIVIFTINFLLGKNTPKEVPTIRYSQSHIYNLIAPFIPKNNELLESPITQSSKHFDSISIKVVFVNNKAYYIKDNIFYVANVEDEVIQHETATVVDTMSMNKVQLKEIMMIVEKLTKG